MGSVVFLPPKKRSELKALALVRLKEAQVLLSKKKPDGAYYLCGYVIECGLKACIAKKTRRYDFPDKDFINKSWSHKLMQLVELAGLAEEHDIKFKAGGDFTSFWKIVGAWSEDARYEKKTLTDARDMYNAISDPQNGVLQWISQHW